MTSLYAHGFARVAACTISGRIGDPVPPTPPPSWPRSRRAMMRAWRSACFPELCAVQSYAIDDLLMQDALLDGVTASVATSWSRRRKTCVR